MGEFHREIKLYRSKFKNESGLVFLFGFEIDRLVIGNRVGMECKHGSRLLCRMLKLLDKGDKSDYNIFATKNYVGPISVDRPCALCASKPLKPFASRGFLFLLSSSIFDLTKSVKSFFHAPANLTLNRCQSEVF